MMVRAVRVPKKEAESVRAELLASGMLDRTYRLKAEGNDVLIPVTSDHPGDATDVSLEPIEQKETDYRNLFPAPMKDSLPSSFDVIGDVAVVKIPEDMMDIRNDIGEAIMNTTSNIRAVMMDSGVKGDLRIRELEQIAGTGTSETVHKEFGVRMATDPAKVYFNPRLATERMRIASDVKDGEIIIDMFAGAAPFPLVISKHADPSVIYAIDLNPDAVAFMERNIAMNHFDNIVPIHGDARKITKDLPKADRIIMNLPQSAQDFLTDALDALKDGGMIHMHRISERDADHDDIVEKATSAGFDIEIREMIELKTYSPSMSVFVFDIVKLTS